MDESAPSATQPGPAFRGPSRRWFLAGGAGLIAGGAAGAVVELVSDDGPPEPPTAPPALLAAARAERALIADLDATTGGTPAVRQVIGLARADHAAHLEVLTAMLARYRRPPAPHRRPRGRPRTLAQPHLAEIDAARDAAERAASLAGASAALLASIAACEASHAELFQ
jgi:hypothetical protein